MISGGMRHGGSGAVALGLIKRGRTVHEGLPSLFFLKNVEWVVG